MMCTFLGTGRVKDTDLEMRKARLRLRYVWICMVYLMVRNDDNVCGFSWLAGTGAIAEGNQAANSWHGAWGHKLRSTDVRSTMDMASKLQFVSFLLPDVAGIVLVSTCMRDKIAHGPATQCPAAPLVRTSFLYNLTFFFDIHCLVTRRMNGYPN